MPDWRTIRQDVAEECRAETDDRNIDRCLVQALNWHRSVQTYFTEREETILTVANQEEYTLSAGWVARVGKAHYQHAGSTTQIPMEHRTWDWLQGYRNRFGADEFSNYIHGYPRIYSIKPDSGSSFAGRSVLFAAPTPAVANDVMEIRYIADLGTPTIDFTPNYGWRVLDENGTGITGDWTTRWLVEGYYLIRSYAKMLYHQKYSKDSDEEAAGQKEWATQMAEMKRLNTKKRKPDSVRPYLRSHI